MTRTLIEKLEAAEGPSRELDAEVAVALAGWEWHGGGEPREFQRFAGHWKKPGEEGYGTLEGQLCKCAESGNSEPPPYTSSLDAAVALVERVLPEITALEQTTLYRNGKSEAFEVCIDIGQLKLEPAFGASPAIALCIALLKALEAWKESEYFTRTNIPADSASAIGPRPTEGREGWICPRCRTVWRPCEEFCKRCKAPTTISQL